MGPTKTESASGGKSRITELQFVVSDFYAYGMFNSCQDVQNPSTNEKAMNMVCGTKSCTPQKWLDYMGSTSNHYAPFQINYDISDTPVTYKKSKLNPMNATIEPCATVCSCQDCRDSCDKPLPPLPPPTPWTILGIDGISFVMASTFAAFLVVFLSGTVWHHIICVKTAEPQSVATPPGYTVNEGSPGAGNRTGVLTDHDVNCCQKIGAWLEQKTMRGFKLWGRMCARHPYWVLPIGLILCGILIGGIGYFKVMTDPVELWSAPSSRARQEREYFDEHFT